MNANELSLELGFYAEGFSGDFAEHLKNSATMLRQQQAEIEALKADNEQMCKALANLLKQY
ncbi:hypothetical protein [Polynucleobacter sp. AP-RePozz3-80-G7]|uniref:hypothetical protein n=1 Tax=Polynucleobacter sp. AP-RePozz3-80-G7 TaxID=2689105 RepID=UPI001C0BC434|nr:hypothetical protein [Polynucleobacter sp. AP-RePozz3-80-G7]MBU3639983.1 hypothetical protein [Polynucleobacter sp. AP-RePozz3-80-G7]